MRIVDLKTFRALPYNTIFVKYDPCIFGSLMVKSKTIETDFYYIDLVANIEANGSGDWADKLQLAENDSNLSLSLDFETITRDGCYEDGQLFAIYEKKDIEGLIGLLQESLKVYDK